MTEMQALNLAITAKHRGDAVNADKHYKTYIDKLVARLLAEEITSHLNKVGAI